MTFTIGVVIGLLAGTVLAGIVLIETRYEMKPVLIGGLVGLVLAGVVLMATLLQPISKIKSISEPEWGSGLATAGLGPLTFPSSSNPFCPVAEPQVVPDALGEAVSITEPQHDARAPNPEPTVAGPVAVPAVADDTPTLANDARDRPRRRHRYYRWYWSPVRGQWISQH